MNKVKLIYKIDKKYDTQMTQNVLGRVENQISVSKLLRIDENLAMRVLRNKGVKRNKLIFSIIDKTYDHLYLYIKKSVKSYQNSWNEINYEFFNLVKKITGYDWKFGKYYCAISVFHGGISNWGGNKIVRIWSENPYMQRRTTAHELVLSHIWMILENRDISKTWSDDKKWQYAEIITWCLLGLQKDFVKFWPWIPTQDLFPTKHNYPQLLSLQKKLGLIYKKSKTFSQFLNNAIC